MRPEMYIKLFRTASIRINKYTVIGIDPGETTGIIIAKVLAVEHRTGASGSPRKNIYVNLCGKSLKTYSCISETLLDANAEIWVVENFRLAPNRAKALSFNALKPVRIIGMLEYIADGKGIDIAFQNPADIANIRPLTKSMYNWHTKHEHDAGSHALAYISKRENVPLERLEVVKDELFTTIPE